MLSLKRTRGIDWIFQHTADDLVRATGVELLLAATSSVALEAIASHRGVGPAIEYLQQIASGLRDRACASHRATACPARRRDPPRRALRASVNAPGTCAKSSSPARCACPA